MITRHRITQQCDPLFQPSWSLYISAFPEEERRSLPYQLATLQRNDFYFEALYNEDTFIGIIGWWDFAEVRYIEHLATSPLLRNGGYGKRILASFARESNKPILLEVEHPEDELTKRRVGFYERQGFVLNPHHYAHPSYGNDPDALVALQIMTHPSPISESDLQHFMLCYFPVIHFRHYTEEVVE